jgi:chromate transport protein ChrA
MTVTQKWTLAVGVGTAFAGIMTILSAGLPHVWPGALFMFVLTTCTARFMLDVDWK